MKTIWHKGEPPHVGWWRCKDPMTLADEWRWWSGRKWSVYLLETDDLAIVNHCAGMKTAINDIRWCEYWPENARVPRRKP